MILHGKDDIKDVVIDSGKFRGRKIGDLSLDEAQRLYSGWNGIENPNHHHRILSKYLKEYLDSKRELKK